jgi:hypothetical protein
MQRTTDAWFRNGLVRGTNNVILKSQWMLYWNCQPAATNSRIDDRRVANNTTLHQPERMEYLPWPKTDRRWYWPAS